MTEDREGGLTFPLVKDRGSSVFSSLTWHEERSSLICGGIVPLPEITDWLTSFEGFTMWANVSTKFSMFGIEGDMVFPQKAPTVPGLIR